MLRRNISPLHGVVFRYFLVGALRQSAASGLDQSGNIGDAIEHQQPARPAAAPRAGIAPRHRPEIDPRLPRGLAVADLVADSDGVARGRCPSASAPPCIWRPCRTATRRRQSATSAPAWSPSAALTFCSESERDHRHDHAGATMPAASRPTPANSGMAEDIRAFSRRMSAAISGIRQNGTASQAMISRDDFSRNISTSPSSMRLNRCLSAREFTTDRNHCRLSDSVPSRSNIASCIRA